MILFYLLVSQVKPKLSLDVDIVTHVQFKLNLYIVFLQHCADGDRVLPSLPKTRIQSVAKEKPLADGRNPFKLVTCRTFDNATVQVVFITLFN